MRQAFFAALFPVFFALLFSTQKAAAQKSEVADPAVFELLHIAYALTETGQKGWQGIFPIDTSTAYFQKIQQCFGPARGHLFVQKLERKSGLQTIMSLIGNRSISAFLAFKKKEKIGWLDQKPAWGLRAANRVLQRGITRRRFRKRLADFARTTDFVAFYAENEPFRAKMLADAASVYPIEKMQTWLEQGFSTRFSEIKILVSPLVGDSHNFLKFKKNGRSACLLVVPLVAPNEAEGELFLAQKSGLIFTEIDHGYCNPAAAPFKKRIKKALADRAKWVDPTAPNGKAYHSAQKIFNEYTTHAIHILWLKSTFSASVFEKQKAARVKMNVEQRGFRRFGEFTDFLIKTYENRQPTESLENLFPSFVEWFEKG